MQTNNYQFILYLSSKLWEFFEKLCWIFFTLRVLCSGGVTRIHSFSGSEKSLFRVSSIFLPESTSASNAHDTSDFWTLAGIWCLDLALLSVLLFRMPPCLTLRTCLNCSSSCSGCSLLVLTLWNVSEMFSCFVDSWGPKKVFKLGPVDLLIDILGVNWSLIIGGFSIFSSFNLLFMWATRSVDNDLLMGGEGDLCFAGLADLSSARKGIFGSVNPEGSRDLLCLTEEQLLACN